MVTTEMLGFWVTDDPEYLASWITKAQARYTELEEIVER